MVVPVGDVAVREVGGRYCIVTMTAQLQELPRSRLPIWMVLRFLYRHARWLGPYIGRPLRRMPARWASVLAADLSRGVLGAWHRHDLRTLLAIYADDAVIDMSRWSGWPDQAIYQGPDGVRRFFADWDVAWSEFSLRPTRQLRLGPELYLYEIEFEGRGASSGIELRLRFFQIARASNGFIASMANYTEEQEALEAAGVGG